MFGVGQIFPPNPPKPPKISNKIIFFLFLSNYVKIPPSSPLTKHFYQQKIWVSIWPSLLRSTMSCMKLYILLFNRNKENNVYTNRNSTSSTSINTLQNVFNNQFFCIPFIFKYLPFQKLVRVGSALLKFYHFFFISWVNFIQDVVIPLFILKLSCRFAGGGGSVSTISWAWTEIWFH